MNSIIESDLLIPEILLVTNQIHQEECVPEDEEPDEPGCKPRKPPVNKIFLRECDPSCDPSDSCRPENSCGPDDD
jgi:hypothetical protein